MEKEKRPFCPAIWFSGFFGLGAVVLLGALSPGLLYLGCRRPCCAAKEEI